MSVKFRNTNWSKKQYFGLHGTDAPCQMCGGPITLEASDGCHKVRRSKLPKGIKKGHGEAPENMLVAHRDCHEWSHHKRERENFARESPVNARTGGVVQWPKKMLNELFQYKLTFSC